MNSKNLIYLKKIKYHLKKYYNLYVNIYNLIRNDNNIKSSLIDREGSNLKEMTEIYNRCLIEINEKIENSDKGILDMDVKNELALIKELKSVYYDFKKENKVKKEADVEDIIENVYDNFYKYSVMLLREDKLENINYFMKVIFDYMGKNSIFSKSPLMVKLYEMYNSNVYHSIKESKMAVKQMSDIINEEKKKIHIKKDEKKINKIKKSVQNLKNIIKKIVIKKAKKKKKPQVKLIYSDSDSDSKSEYSLKPPKIESKEDIKEEKKDDKFGAELIEEYEKPENKDEPEDVKEEEKEEENPELKVKEEPKEEAKIEDENINFIVPEDVKEEKKEEENPELKVKELKTDLNEIINIKGEPSHNMTKLIDNYTSMNKSNLEKNVENMKKIKNEIIKFEKSINESNNDSFNLKLQILKKNFEEVTNNMIIFNPAVKQELENVIVMDDSRYTFNDQSTFNIKENEQLYGNKSSFFDASMFNK